MRDVFREIWRVLRQPSSGRNWYEWALMALGHAMLGALFAVVLREWVPASWGYVPTAALIAIAYFAAKEIPDLRRGGRISDSVEDAALVFLGATYGGPLWPVIVWAVVVVGAIEKIRSPEGGG